MIGPGKGKIIHEDITFAAPKFCLPKIDVYAHNTFC